MEIKGIKITGKINVGGLDIEIPDTSVSQETLTPEEKLKALDSMRNKLLEDLKKVDDELRRLRGDK